MKKPKESPEIRKIKIEVDKLARILREVSEVHGASVALGHAISNLQFSLNTYLHGFYSNNTKPRSKKLASQLKRLIESDKHNGCCVCAYDMLTELYARQRKLLKKYFELGGK